MISNILKQNSISTITKMLSNSAPSVSIPSAAEQLKLLERRRMTSPRGAQRFCRNTWLWMHTQVSSKGGWFVRDCLGVVGTLVTALCVMGVTVAAMSAVFANSPSRRVVSRDSCDCSCFDGAYKMGYNTQGYKTIHVSFDERLLGIMLWLTTFFVLAISLVRHMTNSLLLGEARLPLALALVCQLYPHHYSMWAGFNYLNEGLTGFMAVQIVFAGTEVLSTALGAAQLNTKTPLSPKALWGMVFVSLLHAWHNTADWTTDKLGMVFMLVADLVQGFIALYYISRCIGSMPSPWFATPASSSANAKQFKEEHDQRGGNWDGDEDDGRGGAGRERRNHEDDSKALEQDPEATQASAASASSSSSCTAPRTIYTLRSAVVDAVCTVVAVVFACIALKLWHDIARTIPEQGKV
jgi:hypothetical protein